MTGISPLWPVLALGSALAVSAPAAVTVSMNCVADTFIRASVASNYGGGGSLNVSGASATNGNGITNGEFAAFLKFSSATAGALFDAALGSGGWAITGAALRLTEVAQPGNALFNIGAGRSLVQWTAKDTWLEGTGTPNSATLDGMIWPQRTAYLLPADTETSGMVENTAANGPRTADLALSPRLLADLMAGGEVSFYLSALTGTTGFNFRSRSYTGDTVSQPALLLTASAIPEPGTPLLLLLAAGLRWARKR